MPPASSSERQQEVRDYTSPPALRTDGTPHGPRTDHAPRAWSCAVRVEYTTLAHARESPQGGDTAPYGDRLYKLLPKNTQSILQNTRLAFSFLHFGLHTLTQNRSTEPKKENIAYRKVYG